MTMVKTVREPRSPVVAAILTTLDRKRWMSLEDLVAAVGKKVTKEAAQKAYDDRIHQWDRDSELKQLRLGRKMQVLLTCITLFQQEKIEQRGRGPTKEYRRLV